MKKKYYIIIAIIILLLGVGLYFVLKDNEKEPIETDSQKFKKEYTEVSENNVFVYRSADEIIKILKNGTGVVYLGFPECKWCQAYVPMLNDVAKEVGIEKIYYYDVLEDRANNTKEYQEMLSILGDNLQYDQEGNPRIYVPNVSFHINGKIIGNDYETSLDTHNLSEPSEYWTEDEIKDLKETLTEYMQEVYNSLNTCTECNK